MATHSNILAWEIPGTEEPGGSMGRRVGHNLVTNNENRMSQEQVFVVSHCVWGVVVAYRQGQLHGHSTCAAPHLQLTM